MSQLQNVPGFTPLVEALSSAIGGFDNKYLAFAIALAILFGACLVWARMHFWGHRHWLKPILQVTKGLREVERRVASPEQRIDEANQVFSTVPDIEPLWREYHKHLRRNPEANGYLNLVDPRAWFSLDALPGRGYEQWCGTWAGVFLTVGLLFTFLGLSAALLIVGSIDFSDTAAIRDAIARILGVSSAKFITSIAGLLAYSPRT